MAFCTTETNAPRHARQCVSSSGLRLDASEMMVSNQEWKEGDIRLLTGGAETFDGHALHEGGQVVHVIVASNRYIR